ncbi:MAG: phage protein Gp36 family protein [Phycisphaerae bacterium]
MSYITNADIEERLGTAAYIQLTDDDGDGTADIGVVDEARLGADGEVNSYLARRFAVPIDLTAHPEVADILATITLDLAEYRLRVRRPPVPAEAAAKRDAAIAWLARVAAGTIEVPSLGTIAPNPAAGPTVHTTGEPRLLTRDELADH